MIYQFATLPIVTLRYETPFLSVLFLSLASYARTRICLHSFEPGTCISTLSFSHIPYLYRLLISAIAIPWHCRARSDQIWSGSQNVSDTKKEREARVGIQVGTSTSAIEHVACQNKTELRSTSRRQASRPASQSLIGNEGDFNRRERQK